MSAPMQASERRVVISGIGLISPLGIGPRSFWNALAEGRGAVRKIHAFPVDGIPTDAVAEVLDFDPKSLGQPQEPQGSHQEPQVHGSRHPARRRRGRAGLCRRRLWSTRASIPPGSESIWAPG